MPERCTARAVAISHDDNMVVVGMKDGTVCVIQCDALEDDLGWSLENTKLFKHAKEWISDIKFSPDDTKCAIGSHDNKIYIYNLN